TCNALDLKSELGERGEGVTPQIHRGRAGVTYAPSCEAIEPNLTFRRGDDPDRKLSRLEHRSLLDMQFDHGFKAPVASAFATGIADCLQRFADAHAVGIRTAQSGLARHIAGEHLGAHYARG